jgi:hypothetical protein
MSPKTIVLIGASVGGIGGGYLGSLLDHGNGFGLWSILLSTVGGIAGIIAGYKINQNIGD